VRHIAENIAYFGKGTDLSFGFNQEEGGQDCVQFNNLNLIAAYMFHALA
jgi:hypothetical protein